MNRSNFVFDAIRRLADFLANNKRTTNRCCPQRTVRLLEEGFELEPRLLLDAYVWDSGNNNVNTPGGTAWGATKMAGGKTYTNWLDTTQGNNWTGVPGLHNATNDTVSFQSGNPGSSVNCTLGGSGTGALTLAGFMMGNGTFT